MTEERIKEIYTQHLNKKYKPPKYPEEKRAREDHINYLIPPFLIIASEARKEGAEKAEAELAEAEKEIYARSEGEEKEWERAEKAEAD